MSDSIEVGCPTCKAKAGELCKSERGATVATHRARLQLADARGAELEKLRRWNQGAA